MGTETETESPDKWWQEGNADGWNFYRDVGEWVEILMEGQVLVLTRTGEEFHAVVRWERKPTGPEELASKRQSELVQHQSPEAWWAGLCPAIAEFYQKLEGLLVKVGGDKVLRIRKQGRTRKATLVLRLKAPTQPGIRGGRAEVN